MKRPKTTTQPPDTYTIARFCELAGFDRHTLAQTIQEIGLEPAGKSARQKADVYTLRSLVRAALGGDIEAEKLRLTRETADKLSIANMRARGELIEVALVKRLGERVMVAIRQKILSFRDLTADQQDACLIELMGLKNIDWEREAMRDA